MRYQHKNILKVFKSVSIWKSKLVEMTYYIFEKRKTISDFKEFQNFPIIYDIFVNFLKRSWLCT